MGYDLCVSSVFRITDIKKDVLRDLRLTVSLDSFKEGAWAYITEEGDVGICASTSYGALDVITKKARKYGIILEFPRGKEDDKEKIIFTRRAIEASLKAVKELDNMEKAFLEAAWNVLKMAELLEKPVSGW